MLLETICVILYILVGLYMATDGKVNTDDLHVSELLAAVAWPVLLIWWVYTVFRKGDGNDDDGLNPG